MNAKRITFLSDFLIMNAASFAQSFDPPTRSIYEYCRVTRSALTALGAAAGGKVAERTGQFDYIV